MFSSASVVLSLASLLLVNATPLSFADGRDCDALGGHIVPAFNGPWGGFGVFSMCYVPKTATNYGNQCITSSGQHYYWQEGSECSCTSGCNPLAVGRTITPTFCNLTNRAQGDCLVLTEITVQLNDTMTLSNFGLDSLDNTIALTSIPGSETIDFQLGYDQTLRHAGDQCVILAPFQGLSALALGGCDFDPPALFSTTTLPSGLQTLIYIDGSKAKHCLVQNSGRIVVEDCNSGHPSILAYVPL